MSNADELSILRRRFEELEVRADSIRAARRTPMGRYVGIVYDGGSIPSSGASKYHLTHPVNVSGAETEGGAGTLTIDTDQSVPVLILDGPCAVGDYVVAKLIDGRWVAEEGRGAGGGATGSLPGCTCSAPPATLYMTVSGTCNTDYFNNCTIQYGATPPLLVGSLGANGYFSTTTFTESSSGDLFYINLFCTGSTMSIRRVFESATSFGGAPYVDTVFFFWTVGFPGNACSPFLLSAGDDGSGSPPCLVTISA